MSHSHPVVAVCSIAPETFGQGAENAHEQVRADYWAIFDLPEDVEPGLDAVTESQSRIDAFATAGATPTRGGALPAR